MKKVALSFILVFLALGLMANSFILAEGNNSGTSTNSESGTKTETTTKTNDSTTKTETSTNSNETKASTETRNTKNLSKEEIEKLKEERKRLQEKKNEIEERKNEIKERINEHRENLTEEHKKRIFEERNRLRGENSEANCPVNCKCSGSAIKCLINGTRELTIHAGESGNLIIQIKDIEVSASANVQLYKENDTIYARLKNNETRMIRYLPDEVKMKIRERIKAKLENESIDLNEDGNYHVKMHKKAKLFFLIPVSENLESDVDAETGVVVIVKKPWWGFMARDEQGESENNQSGSTSGEANASVNVTVNASA